MVFTCIFSFYCSQEIKPQGLNAPFEMLWRIKERKGSSPIVEAGFKVSKCYLRVPENLTKVILNLQGPVSFLLGP